MVGNLIVRTTASFTSLTGILARLAFPDFIAVGTDGRHWLVEVKMDKEMGTPVVTQKRDAARRWANHVSADDTVGVRWCYLLVSETDVKTAKGSWPALKGLGGE